MNNKYILNLTVAELVIVCRALRFMKRQAQNNDEYYDTEKDEVRHDYKILDNLLKQIDPDYNLW